MEMRACTREVLVRRGLLSCPSGSGHIKNLRFPPSHAFLSHDAMSAHADPSSWTRFMLLARWALPHTPSSPSSTTTTCSRLPLTSCSQLGTSCLVSLVHPPCPPTMFLLAQEFVESWGRSFPFCALPVLLGPWMCSKICQGENHNGALLRGVVGTGTVPHVRDPSRWQSLARGGKWLNAD